MPAHTATRRKLLIRSLSATAISTLWTSRLAIASNFPGNQPVKIVVPATPGGTADIVARLLSSHMSTQLKTPFVIENISGAGGTVGAARVARSAPTGHTLMLGFTSNVGTAPILVRNLAYDPVRDFSPIGRAVSVSLCVVAHASFPVNDMKGLVSLAQQRGKESPIMYGAWSNGSAAHLTMESINFHSNAGMKMVPYKSEADVQRALLGEEVSLGPQTIGLLLPHLRAGKFKALGIASRQRSSLLPQVATLAEQGIPFDLAAWLGLFAPACTPEPVLTQLHDSMKFALRQSDVQERCRNLGMDIDGGSRQDFKASIPTEIATWRQLIQAAGVQIE